MINLFSNKIKNYLFKKKLKFIDADDPHIIFSDIWSGNSQNGELITNAKYPINEIQNIDNFDFLRDLKSCGILKTRSIARKIVNHWIDNNKNLFSKSFKPNLIAERITIMCMTYSWYAKSGDIKFQKKNLNSIYIQLELLDYLLKKNTNLYNFKTIKGLIIGNIFLFNDLNKINSFLNRLKTLSENFILKDGGHLSRCPMIQLDVLRDLLEIRSAIATNRKLNSPIIQTLVKVMGDYFKIFCVTKDSFCSFNSGSLIKKEKISETLKRLSGTKYNFSFARHSGYISISSNDLNMILDAGNKDLFFNNKILNNKASLCAFELFYQKAKIITNVGSFYFKSNNNNDLRAISSTAAHSSLSIDDRNNLDLTGLRKINHLEVKKNEDENGYLVQVSHDAYKSLFGIGHKRRLFISKKSPDLIGEDEIFSIGNYGIKPKFATIRFHLHHEINPIKLQNQNLLLQNSTNKIIGKFFSSSDNIEIENTIIYQNSERYVSKQIVILVELKKIRELNKFITKWSLKFEK